MSRLLYLYSQDAGIIVGARVTPFPVAVLPIGYQPVTTTVQTGWVNTRNGTVRTNINRSQQRSGRWAPVYTSSTTYVPVAYAPVAYSFMAALPAMPMNVGFRSTMI